MRILAALMLALLIASPATAEDTKKIPTNKCTAPIDTSTTAPAGATTDDIYWDIGFSSNAEAAPVSVYFDPNITGAGTGETLTLQACLSAEVTGTCLNLLWDSTGDGNVDTNILTGLTAATSGLNGISGFPYLRIQETGTPSTDARYVVCRTQ